MCFAAEIRAIAKQKAESIELMETERISFTYCTRETHTVVTGRNMYIYLQAFRVRTYVKCYPQKR